MSRPTHEELLTARKLLTRRANNLPVAVRQCVNVLLAATEPPTDDEIRTAYNKLRGYHYNAVDHAWFERGVRHFLGPVKP